MTLAIAALALLLTGASQVEAQQPPNVPRVGVLGPGIRGAFEEGLRQFGYVEGKNIAIEWRSASGQSGQFADAAAELVRLKVDVIVAANNPAIAAAQKATPTIPIVMVLATDPVSSGFVSSLGRPAGNLTGLSMQTPELAARSRLPTMCTAREWMDAGFVISYGPSLNDMYRRAPYFVDRILNGAKPADLPVEQPTRFELVINAKAARTLGLTIPPSLLVRAEHVSE